jgi:hypothetical protein
MKPHPFIAVAAWIAFWTVHQAGQEPGHDTSALAGLVLLVFPQFFLGLIAGRWWVAALPLSLGVWFTIWAVNHPTSGLSEISNVPVLLGLAAAVIVLAGVACSLPIRRSDTA